jgi:flavin-binding protein dodecin
MLEHVYKTIELVGSSADGVEDGVRNAVIKASQTLRNCAGSRWWRRGGTSRAAGSRIWQVTPKIGFTLEGNPKPAEQSQSCMIGRYRNAGCLTRHRARSRVQS